MTAGAYRACPECRRQLREERRPAGRWAPDPHDPVLACETHGVQAVWLVIARGEVVAACEQDEAARVPWLRAEALLGALRNGAGTVSAPNLPEEAEMEGTEIETPLKMATQPAHPLAVLAGALAAAFELELERQEGRDDLEPLGPRVRGASASRSGRRRADLPAQRNAA